VTSAIHQVARSGHKAFLSVS